MTVSIIVNVVKTEHPLNVACGIVLYVDCQLTDFNDLHDSNTFVPIIETDDGIVMSVSPLDLNDALSTLVIPE